jgi:hypothetical protein
MLYDLLSLRESTMLGRAAFPCAFHINKSRKENISYNALFLKVTSSTLNACEKVGIKNK